jgi:hypothetical protein
MKEMKFVTRFHNKRSEEDVSYYVAELGTPVMKFEKAMERLYFVAIRLKYTRIGPTMRGEVMPEGQAKAQIEALCKGDDWEEIKTPFE